MEAEPVCCARCSLPQITRILALLSDHPGGLATDAIAGHLGTSKKSALNRLGELSRDGLIERTDGGWTLLTVAQ